MSNATAQTTSTDKPETLPVDVATIRESAEDVITNGAQMEDPDEVETIILLLRGMIMLLVPEVEVAMSKHPKNHIPAICARACIGEAQMRLRLGSGSNLAVMISTAQRLARSVRALADHYVGLGGELRS